MSSGSFGGTIKLRGEAEYRKAITNINSSLKVFASSLKLVTSEYGINNKGATALVAQQKVLERQIVAQESKIQTCKEALKELSKQQIDNKNRVSEMTAKYNEAKQKLELVRNSTTATNEEVKEQENEVKKLASELANTNASYDICGRKINTWKITLNNSKTELNKMETSLRDNQNAMKRYENATEQGKKELTQYGKIIEQSRDKTNNFGDVLKANLASNVIITGIKNLATSVKELVTSLTSVGIPFEKEISKVEAISGATKEELDMITKKAREMGESTSKSATESAEAFSYMSLAGWNTKQMIEGIEPILRMSEAAEADLATTSDLVTDSMSALGIQTNKLGKFLDIVTKTQNSSNTSAMQMLEAYIECGGTFKNLNISLEESATLLGVLANRGMKGSEAGNSLNSVLVNLTGGSKSARDALDKLGVSAWDSKGNFKGVAETVHQLDVALENCTEEQRTNFESAIGGKTQLTTLQNLIAGLKEEYGTLKTNITNCNGALNATAKTMQNNLSGDLTQMKSKIEGIQITIYNKLEPTLRKTIKVLQDWANSVNWERIGEKAGKTLQGIINLFKWFIDKRKIFSSAITGMIAGFTVKKVGDFANSMLGLVNVFKSAPTAISGVTKTMEALNLKVIANPYVALGTAITALVAGFTAWYYQTEKMNSSLGGLKEQVEGQRKSWEELESKRNETLSNTMTEISTYQRLSKELSTIVDENGKIKERISTKSEYNY